MNQNSSPLPHKVIGVAVIRNEQGQILIDRRLQEGEMGGLWEFPGGKIEANETIEECIKREIKEEIGINIEIGEYLTTIDYTYTTLRVTLIVHNCRYVSGIPTAIECDEIHWVRVDELKNYTFPEANAQIISVLEN
ncbi:MAG: 8-oxo-dGTP diphosphatase MutT [Cyanobacteria bacterium P01_A01_bin.84]